jgi:GTP cyclohydrolase I/GTP cyclohydrolase-4
MPAKDPEKMTDIHPSHTALIDVQSQTPGLALSLSRVGVTDVEKVIRLRQNGTEQLFSARFECVIELGSDQKGAHMSRFEEVVNESIGEVVFNDSSFKVETLAEHIAQLVRSRQGARRAEVSVEARFPEHKPAPVSGVNTQELYTLHGVAVATDLGTRRLVGVTAQGMTACPCAQGLIAAKARERLDSEGFDEDEIERILQAVPVATHNQRGLGTLHIGCTELCVDEIDAAPLLEIVEHAMSSEIYELMKRSDEAHVVDKAHRRPRFVEDCVREMVRGVIARFPALHDRAFVSANQVNLETIHQHNVVAERFGTLGEIREELRTGVPSPRHTSLSSWLSATP